MDRIICVVGPTASGKTALAVELAKALDGEVIGCDSMQIYRRLDIGTAKPAAAETQGVPHHMIDIVEPSESYSAARYVADATAVAEEMLSRGKMVILAGGTGLYMDAFIQGLDFSTAENHDIIRVRLENLYDRFGGERMHRLLGRLDSGSAAKIHPNDRKRVVRALEIVFGGERKSEHDELTKSRPPRFDALKIGITCEDRAELYRRIDLRVDAMLEQGLLDEVRMLKSMPTATAAQAIGYKELMPALDDMSLLDECVETLKRNSRRYAKRQLTWLRRDKGTVWFYRDREDFDSIAAKATEFAKDFLYNQPE